MLPMGEVVIWEYWIAVMEKTACLRAPRADARGSDRCDSTLTLQSLLLRLSQRVQLGWLHHQLSRLIFL